MPGCCAEVPAPGGTAVAIQDNIDSHLQTEGCFGPTISREVSTTEPLQHVLGSFIPKRSSWHQKKSSVRCVNPSVKVTVTPFYRESEAWRLGFVPVCVCGSLSCSRPTRPAGPQSVPLPSSQVSELEKAPLLPPPRDWLSQIEERWR